MPAIPELHANGVQWPGVSIGSSCGGLDIDTGLLLTATAGLAAGFTDLPDAIRAWAPAGCPLSCWPGAGPGYCGRVSCRWPWRSADVFHGRQVAIAVIDFGRQAHADGSSGVLARVVETPWTISATPDAARHRGAASSAGAGLDRRSDPP